MPALTPMPVELCLFGPPRLLRGGVALHVGSRKALLLLAMVALDGAMPRDRLAASLWPDVANPAARRNLRREVFRLRELGCLQADSHGALRLAGTLSVDVHRFRQALSAGDDAAALIVAEAGLFDGLDGVAGTDADAWLARWRAALQMERQAARVRHADVLEQRGELAAALALHREALVEDPCAEAAARRAMSLHAALGNRGDALAAYARLGQALQDELGLAPDAATQALAAGLRGGTAAAFSSPAAPAGGRMFPALPRADADADADADTDTDTDTSTYPATLLADRLPFVGRSTERARIAAAWAAGQRVYLSGAPGAGKTRLASECGATQGAWLRVACAPDDAEQPYASAVRALRALLEAAPDEPLPDWVRRELAALLPEFGPAPAPVASAEAAGRLHTAFAHAWHLLLRDNFNALLLDDWQWADAASVDLWNRLDDRGSAVRWIVAHRSAALPAAALQRMRQDVDGGRAVAVVLNGLDADEALALVRALSRSTGGQGLAQRLQRATEGNPFFLIETLRHLAEQGRLRVAEDGTWHTDLDALAPDDTELPVPASVREAVLGRVRALGEPARRLLEAASLAGDAFDLHLLAGITPLTAVQAVSVLEHAQAAQLVQAGDSGHRFAHDLVRQCLADSLSPARRRLLHAGLAERLAAGNAAPALVAQQLERAGQAPAAIGWRVQAAEAASRVHALGDASHHYARALADGAQGAQAVAIHLALARLHRRRADNPARDAALADAAVAAHHADAPTRLEVQLAIAEARCDTDRADDALALLDALNADLDAAAPRWRARALTLRARLCGWRGQTEEAAGLRQQAIELLEGLPETLGEQADLLDDAARAALSGGDAAEGEVWARRAVAGYEATGNVPALAQASILLGLAMLHAHNDRVAAQATLDRARALAARCGHVPAQRSAILNLIKLHTDAGRADAALALLEEGESLAAGFEHPRAAQAFAQARYFIHYLRGDLAEATRAADRLMALARQVANRRIVVDSAQMVADLFLHTGQLNTAAALLDESDAVEAGSELRSTSLLAKRAWWHLASGRPAAALERLGSHTTTRHAEDRWLVAWIGAAAALATGDVDAAGAWLAGVDIHADAPTDALSMVLVQRLAVAHARAGDDAAARRRATDLLATGAVPALEAARLRAALTGHAFNAFSTPHS